VKAPSNACAWLSVDDGLRGVDGWSDDENAWFMVDGSYLFLQNQKTENTCCAAYLIAGPPLAMDTSCGCSSSPTFFLAAAAAAAAAV